LYKFQRSGELGEPRGSPTIDGTARQAGALAPWVRVALDQPWCSRTIRVPSLSLAGRPRMFRKHRLPSVLSGTRCPA
jgi:hypothetical protein